VQTESMRHPPHLPLPLLLACSILRVLPRCVPSRSYAAVPCGRALHLDKPAPSATALAAHHLARRRRAEDLECLSCLLRPAPRENATILPHYPRLALSWRQAVERAAGGFNDARYGQACGTTPLILCEHRTATRRAARVEGDCRRRATCLLGRIFGCNFLPMARHSPAGGNGFSCHRRSCGWLCGGKQTMLGNERLRRLTSRAYTAFVAARRVLACFAGGVRRQFGAQQRGAGVTPISR